MPDIPYVTEQKNLSDEPASNWKSVEYLVPTIPKAESARGDGGDSLRQSSASIRRGFLASSIRSSITRSGNREMFSLLRYSERPSDLHDVHDIEINEVSERASGNDSLVALRLSSV